MRAVIPDALRSFSDDWQMSPGIAANGFLFLTGMTGVAPDGTLSADPEVQIRTAFAQVGLVLAEAGAGFCDVVEMTSYHIGLRDHLPLFRRIRAEHVAEAWPAWTAIEVAGFATEDVVIELRVIARLPRPDTDP